MASVGLFRRVVSQLRLSALRTISSATVRDPVTSDRQPNTFGTLGQDTARIRFNQLPEEEGDLETVEYIDGIEGKTRLPVFKYSRLIKKLIDKNKLREALEVLDDRMKTEKARPDLYTYNLLISSCAAHGYTKKAFQLFNQMKKRAIPFSGSTYTSLMNACANSPFPEDGLKRATQLRELMVEKGHQADERTYHATIKAFGRCGDLEQAFNIVDEMLDRRLLVSNDTYNFLLQACASNKNVGFRHALMVWRKMMSSRIRPTVYSYNLLLRCTRDCSVGDMDTIQNDIAEMVSPRRQVTKHIEAKTSSWFIEEGEVKTREDALIPVESSSQGPPNLILPNPQLGSVVGLKEIKQPWDRLALIGGMSGFLSTMAASKSSPDIKTFTLLLDTLEPSIEAEEELIQQMKSAKVKLDLDFCNMLIKKRAMSYRFDDAKQTMRLIKERRFKPNLVTFGVLALACRNFIDAKELIDTINELGYRVNIEILGSLFLRASQKYDLQMMRYVLSTMRQAHVKPNRKFLAHIDNFQKRMNLHLEKKAKGDHHLNELNVPGYEENYRQLCENFEKLRSSEIEDNENIHPWKQFRPVKTDVE